MVYVLNWFASNIQLELRILQETCYEKNFQSMNFFLKWYTCWNYFMCNCEKLQLAIFVVGSANNLESQFVTRDYQIILIWLVFDLSMSIVYSSKAANWISK